MTLKLLETYSQVIHAEMAKSYLASHGIACEIHDAHIVSTQWLYSNLVGGVKLKVNEVDFAKAQDLLTNLPHDLPDDELKGPECPSCHSTKTEFIAAKMSLRRLVFLIWILIPGFTLPVRQKDHYQCTECENKWSEGNSSLSLSFVLQLLISLAITLAVGTVLYSILKAQT